jgi:TRAP-type mannitol/chloroaromatic compound transport system substrate-binding protein
LKELTEKHGVILHDTPKDYFVEYQKATNKVMDKYKAENAFFKKVWDSMKEFADLSVPFWAQAQRTNANLAEEYVKSQKK